MPRLITPRTVALSLEYHLLKRANALLKSLVPARVQGMLRRRARARYLVWEARRYNEWMRTHLERRRVRYAGDLEPGLLSIATPVWDGSPLPYLRLLAESIAGQNPHGACEWLLLDNGCGKPDLQRYLADLAAQFSWVRLHREEKNLGIVGGLRTCLEQASGRYLCTVDSDDLLYPDCLQIVQWWIRQSNFAPLLYSDEDKIIGQQPVQPYFKPDFDPVLLLNSAYIAHLGVVERARALELGAYTDREAEGSPDWDCFVRFYTAGFEAVHIPEVIYSWRMHPESTADDAGSKPYIHSSQQAVIGRYLAAKQFSASNVLRYSPLLPNTADWWIERQRVNPRSMLLVSEEEGPLDYPKLAVAKVKPDASFADLMAVLSGQPDYICIWQSGLQPERTDCLWEAQGLFERYPDTVMVGGWMADKNGAVEDGPLVLGFEGACGCPDFGRPGVDPGYFTQMRKQRSVSAVSSRFAVMQTSFLVEAFQSGGFQSVSLYGLGPWLGRFAFERKQRIVFSPFLRCNNRSSSSARKAAVPAVTSADHRFYPSVFGLNAQTAYQLVPETTPASRN